MSSSMANFTWYKQPKATLMDGFVVPGEDEEGEKYYPADYTLEILNSIRLVSNNKEALDFSREWGLLGYSMSKEYKSYLKIKYFAIVDYLFFTDCLSKELSRDYVEFDSFDHLPRGALENLWGIEAKVIDDLNRVNEDEGITYIHKTRNLIDIKIMGDPVNYYISLANRVNNILKAKYLLELYIEDPLTAEAEFEDWRNGESGITSAALFSNAKSKNEKVLDGILMSERASLTSPLYKKIWITINPATGEHEVSFDNLITFIIYSALSDSPATPKRCSDPKCNQIFFPNRKGQKYCPPLLWEKRSRCEQRHGQAERRRNTKKKHTKQVFSV